MRGQLAFFIRGDGHLVSCVVYKIGECNRKRGMNIPTSSHLNVTQYRSRPALIRLPTASNLGIIYTAGAHLMLHMKIYLPHHGSIEELFLAMSNLGIYKKAKWQEQH